MPIFRSFITQAIKGKAPVPFRVPPGLRMVRVNPATENLATPSDKNAIWEAFIPGTEPQEGQTRPVLDGSLDNENGVPQPQPASTEMGGLPNGVDIPAASMPAPPPAPAPTGTGGLY